MAELFTVIRNGIEMEVEAETPQEAAEKAKQAEALAVPEMSLAERLDRGRRATGSGIRSGAEALAGLYGDVPDLAGGGVGWAAKRLGASEEQAGQMAEQVATGTRAVTDPMSKIAWLARKLGFSDETGELPRIMPTTEDVQSFTDPVVEAVSPTLQERTRFDPATFGERSAFGAGAFLPNILTPGGGGTGGAVKQALTRTGTQVLAPAIATEAAGDVAEKYAPEYEDAVRLLAAAATGGVTAGAENALRLRQAAKEVSASPDALARIAAQLERDGLTPDQAQQAMADLGVDATLMDVGPNLMQEGQRIVAKGGEGRGTITERLGARQEETPIRVKRDVNETLGPATSPARFEAGIAEGKKALSPEYTEALQAPGTKPVDVGSLDMALQEGIDGTIGETKSKLQTIASYLRDGKELNSSPDRALAVRHEIDGLIESADTSKYAKGLLGDIRRKINEQLDVAAPGVRSVDAKFQILAEKDKAFERGTKSLQKGSDWPEDVRTEVAKGEHVLEGFREGARAEIESIIGNKGYNATGLKQAIKSDGTFNRDKLEILFGKEKADRIGKVLDREQTYQRTHVRTTELSPTAERAPEPVAGLEMLRDVGVAGGVGGLPGAATAVGVNTFRAAVDTLRKSAAAARDSEVASLLSSSNPSEVLRGVELAQRKGFMLPRALASGVLARPTGD